MIGYALTSGTVDVWLLFSNILGFKLSEGERGAIAFAALRSLPPQAAALVAGEALFDCDTGAGPPPCPLGDPLEEARWWTASASPEELRAYCLAAFRAMPEADRRDFAAFAGRNAG